MQAKANQPKWGLEYSWKFNPVLQIKDKSSYKQK